MLANEPHYAFGITAFNGRATVIIIDLYDEQFPTPTVTNAVEWVLERIYTALKCLPTEPMEDIETTEVELVNGRPDFIVYKDSCGDWAEIVVDENGEFLSFAAIPNSTLKQLLGES